MFQSRIVLTLIGLAGVSVLLACSQTDVSRSSASSETKSLDGTKSSSTTNKSARSDPAVKAYLDPKTGELRDPTAEELAAAEVADANKKALSAPVATEQSTPREVIHPGGIVEVPLDQSKQQALQACIQKDGSIKMGHECDSEKKPIEQGAK